ncbi:MAG TPA: hypothetical protein G4O15_15630 [Dehalococcoidia bacterium]|nr:hypothetical protein [Dehalococcoidia bacterium]
MENTDKIKDMITLIEQNNESYHDALSHLADTFKKSLSSNLHAAIKQELTGGKQRAGLKNPITTLGKLFSGKS